MTNKRFIRSLFTAAIFMLIVFTKHVTAQQTTFRINYDFNNFDFASTAGDALTNGNYILAGWNTNIFPLTATLTEVNSSGGLVWSKRYTSSLSMQINDLKRDVASNTYYACGGTESGAAFIMVLNSTGTPTISRNFSLAQADGTFLNRLVKTSDGGYVAVGYVTGYDPDGAGPEIKFSTINYTNVDGSASERIGSPLIVKFNANGDHVWHRVTRYYKNSGKAPADRIYNDASFTDVVEVSDGYIAVGMYDVNDFLSNRNSDDDDATSNDALFLKTTTAGAITYHRQIDAPNTDPAASSKRLYSIKKTAAGLPIIAGEDGSSMLFMRLAASGAWANPTWIRRYSTTAFVSTMIVSNFFETFDGNYAAIGQYINPLAFQIGQGIIKINPSNNSVIFGRSYDLGLFSILPNGSAVADKGFISATLGMGGTNFDMQIVKTDSAGNAPTDCPAANLSTSNNAPSYSYADPYYNSWNANTVTNGTFTPVVTTVTPGVNVVCRTIACTPPPAPTVTLSNNNPVCPGTSVTINASGGSNVTYRVYTQQTGGTSIGTTPRPVSPNVTTIYWVEADDNSNPGCVSARTSVTVNVNPAAPTQAAIAGNNNPCPSSQNYTVTAANATTYNWSVSGGGTVTGSGASATVNWTTAGNHTISVVASNSCGSVTGTYPVTVLQGPPTVTVGVGGNTSPCPVSETYTVTVSGASNYTWSVSGGGTITGNGASATVNWTTPGGPYTISVDATNSCGTASSSTTVNVQQGAPVSPNPIIGNSPVCIGTAQYGIQSVPNASGYTWSVSGGGTVAGGQGTENATINWISGGTYTVSVTTNNACGNSAPQTLQVEVTPNAPNGLGTITGATTVCPGTETYTVGAANNATSYKWTVGAGGTIVSGQGTASIAVDWSAISGSSTVSVTADNVCGSTQANSINVTLLSGAPAAPALISGNDNPCPGVLAYSVATVAGASDYIWTLSGGGTIVSGQGTNQISIDWTTSGGPYTLSVVAENICGTSAAVILDIDVQQGVPLVPGNISGDDELCPGNATYSIQPVQGAVDYTWTVSAGGTIASGQGTESITINWTTSGGPYTVSVVANSTCASSNPATIDVTVKNGVPATPSTITGQNSVCSGTQNYSVPVVSGATSYDWTISGGGTITSGQGTNNITIDWTGTSGSYTISVVASNDCGASSASTLSVTILPAVPATPGVIAGNTNACPTVNIYSVENVPNATGYTWSVSTGGVIVDGQGSNTASIQWSGPGTYTISVTASNTCGNSAPQTVTVNVNPAPTAPTVFVSSDDICEGESTTITASNSTGGAAISYNFFDAATGGNLLGNSPLTVSPTTTTTYYLEVVNEFGCRNSGGRIPTVVNVRQAPSAPVVAAGKDRVCFGASTTLSATATPAGSTITWWSAETGGTLLGTGSTFNTSTITENTTIYVQADATNGCSNLNGRTEAEITVLALPEVTLISDKENNAVFPNEAITFTALPGSYDNYEFFVNGISVQSKPDNTFASSKLFDKDSVSVIATEGDCVSEPVAVIVNVRDFPNAFTPNNDGTNDYFLKDYDIVVLNRWGQELYRGVDGWDGTFDGKKVSPGTYFYILTLDNITDRQNIIKGTVLLIQD